MALEKLEIQREVSKDKFEFFFEVPFNPKQLSFSTQSRWHPAKTQANKPDKQYGGGDGSSLSLELFFDSSEKHGSVPAGSVRESIDLLRQLTVINPKLKRPPKCLLFWGVFGGAEGRLFTGMLQSIQETYTLFRPDGTPIRATVQCSFTESINKKEEAEARLPRQGTSTVTANSSQTLSSISGDQYGDPSAWRTIAEANRIDDPLELPSGTPLLLPPLKGVL